MVKNIKQRLFNGSTLIRSLLMAVLFLIGNPCYATSVNIGSYTYKITRFWGSGQNGETQAMITGIAPGKKIIGDIIIPDTIVYNGKSYPVVGIGEGDFSGILEGESPVFYNNDMLTSVTLPSTIRFIGSNEFIGCHNITGYRVLPGNKDFCEEDGSLYKKNYTSDEAKVSWKLCKFPSARKVSTLVIPSKAYNVGAGAFAANDHIKILILSGDQILDSKWQLGNKTIENVDCKSSKIYSSPEKGVIIYGNMFIGVCPGLKRESYTIPEGYKYIDDGAFCESQIQEVTFPKSMPDPLDAYLFMNSAIKKINFSGEVPNTVGEGCFINATQLTEINLQGNSGGRLEFSTSAFFNCSSLVNVNLSENVTSILFHRHAFQGCSALKEFPLTSKMTVAELNSYAFAGCSSLTSFSFSRVKQIEDLPGYEFKGTGLTYVNWPSNLAEIPYGCFKDCKDLVKINLKMTTESIREIAFAGSGLTAVSLMGVNSYYTSSFVMCDNLSRIYFPFNDSSTVRYQSFDFKPASCEVIVNNPNLERLSDQAKCKDVDVKLYISSFSPDLPKTTIGDNWKSVYVPGGAKNIYSSLTNSEVKEMYSYQTSKNESKVRLASLAEGVRITGVIIEGKEANLVDGWWQTDSQPSDEEYKMNVMVNYTVYNNPMTTTYEYIFEDCESKINETGLVASEVIKEFTNTGFEFKTKQTWTIYDMTGAKILSGESDYIDISNFNKGTYLLKISENLDFSVKFIR